MSDKCECPARKALEELSGMIPLFSREIPLSASLALLSEVVKFGITAPCPCEQLRAENADLRKQARESAYKEAQMRGIVDAAEKLLCGLYEHILPLSVHTREVMRDLRNALGDEQDSRQEIGEAAREGDRTRTPAQTEHGRR